jgi:hypothetical protein
MLEILLLILLGLQNPVLSSDNGVVAGRLRTADGKPAAGVRVTAMLPPADGDVFTAVSMSSIAQTDEEGRYRLENIPPGRYLISAGNIATPTYFPGTLDVLSGRIVTVGPKAVVENINFSVQSGSAGRASVSYLGGGPTGLNIPVSIKIEGNGPVPVFQNGIYPLLTFTEIPNARRSEFILNAVTVNLPLPAPNGTEYKVEFEGLQDGYFVKSMTYGSTDLLKENLKATRQGLGTVSTLSVSQGLSTLVTSSLGGTSPWQLNVVLARALPSGRPSGALVRGKSVGEGDEIYLSGDPGFLYTDGTFEFRDITPGQYNIVKYYKTLLTAAAVTVGERNLDDVKLQRPFLLPVDIFTRDPVKPTGALPQSTAHGLIGLHARVLDANSKEPVDSGAITLTGYANTRNNLAILDDGKAEAQGLLPGLYTLTVNVFGYKTTTQPVTIGVEDLSLEILAEKEPQ